MDPLLEQQTEVPFQIVLQVPLKYSFRFDHAVIDEHRLETLQQQFPSLKIHRVERDEGPGTKLLGLLSMPRSWENDDYIVLVDDDLLYKSCMLQRFQTFILQHPEIQAASFYTFLSYLSFPVGQGAYGFMIRYDALKGFLAYFERIKDQEGVLYHDDMYISYYLYRQGIPIHRLSADGLIYTTHENTQIDALSTLSGQYSPSVLRVKVPLLLYQCFQGDQEK